MAFHGRRHPVRSCRNVGRKRTRIQPLLLIFLAAMSGFCFTGDLFNLFVFFELMSTAAFALCGLKTGEPAPLQGSFNFALTNTVGAFITLTGIGLLYGATGALNMAQMGRLLGSRHDSLVIVACLFVISGFLIKAAIVPFHFWLPDAHAVAPTPVCALFSGIMWPSHLEGRMRWARQLQSGQPADYVAWSMLGVALLGIVLLAMR